MKRVFGIYLSLCVLLVSASAGVMASARAAAPYLLLPAQDNTQRRATKTPVKKRGPVFRATKEQVKQAQAMLKQRGFYNGESTGKLDAETRAGLKKYQEAEGLKATGTLNRVTLEKMNISLTDKQRAVPIT